MRQFVKEEKRIICSNQILSNQLKAKVGCRDVFALTKSSFVSFINNNKFLSTLSVFPSTKIASFASLKLFDNNFFVSLNYYFLLRQPSQNFTAFHSDSMHAATHHWH